MHPPRRQSNLTLQLLWNQNITVFLSAEPEKNLAVAHFYLAEIRISHFQR
jgi:hypothetical protein